MKAAGVVGAATLTSRILGFIRDAVIAWFFGAGFSSDAFIAAFRIPNLLRRLFAEGSLSSAFIPVFTEYIVKQGQAEAFHLARSAFRLLGGVLIVAADLRRFVVSLDGSVDCSRIFSGQAFSYHHPDAFNVSVYFFYRIGRSLHGNS